MKRQGTIFTALPIFLLIGIILAPLGAQGASLSASVKDTHGKPIKDAVVYLLSVTGGPPLPIKSQGAIMDQQDKEFVPYVLPVQVGTSVRFPNKDNIRHHVYSVSPTKRFELPLYKGTPAAPVVFDKPGVVVLGCNIHDWMVAYIYVLETPLFTKTDSDGIAALHDVAAGAYEVRVWHPLMKDKTESTARHIVLTESGVSTTYAFTMKPDWRLKRSPSDGGGGYR